MNCKVVLRVLLYPHSPIPASIFPLCLNLILPSQTHPAEYACCQTPLSLPVLSYSNDIPPCFPKENATAHAGAEEFSSSKSVIYASCPAGTNAMQGIKSLYPASDVLKGRSKDTFKMPPKPYVSCLCTLRHFFFYFKFKKYLYIIRGTPQPVCIYIKRIWEFTRLSVYYVLMPFLCPHFYMDTFKSPRCFSCPDCNIVGVGQPVFVLILPQEVGKAALP